jgi:hypothetical protein
MDNSRLYDSAMDCIKEAVKADSAEDYPRALDLYMRGIDTLLTGIKCAFECAVGWEGGPHNAALRFAVRGAERWRRKGNFTGRGSGVCMRSGHVHCGCALQ